MPFAITRPQSPGMPPLYLARDPDGELMWDPRKREAALLTEPEADNIAASITLHSTAEIEVVGVRNTVE